jgi:hypothetical protein
MYFAMQQKAERQLATRRTALFKIGFCEDLRRNGNTSPTKV